VGQGALSGGYTVLQKLPPEYMKEPGFGVGASKADMSRKHQTGVKMYYPSGGTHVSMSSSGTVMSITCCDNIPFMHGWVRGDRQLNGGRCTLHQDWMSWETLVLAFAIVRDGIRVMMQITMRIKGAGNAEKAAAVLRGSMFGAVVESVAHSAA